MSEFSRNISSRFTHALSHQRPTSAADGKGGFDDAYTELVVLQGRVSPAKQMDIQFAGQNRAKATHAIYLPPGTDARIDDRFTFEGRTFEVTVPNIRPSINIYRKALALEIQEA
ncbi:MAG: head-tail adaptor protein [Gammaproteobacteria bacterium]